MCLPFDKKRATDAQLALKSRIRVLIEAQQRDELAEKRLLLMVPVYDTLWANAWRPHPALSLTDLQRSLSLPTQGDERHHLQRTIRSYMGFEDTVAGRSELYIRRLSAAYLLGGGTGCRQREMVTLMLAGRLRRSEDVSTNFVLHVLVAISDEPIY